MIVNWRKFWQKVYSLPRPYKRRSSQYSDRVVNRLGSKDSTTRCRILSQEEKGK